MFLTRRFLWYSAAAVHGLKVGLFHSAALDVEVSLQLKHCTLANAVSGGAFHLQDSGEQLQLPFHAQALFIDSSFFGYTKAFAILIVVKMGYDHRDAVRVSRLL